MASELSRHPVFGHAMHRLDEIKRINAQGNDFWLAREIHLILGYPVWDKFEPVIEKAKAAFVANGIDPSHHIAQTSRMMKLGKGATRRGVDYFLSRSACDLITMNGDPTKPEIAGAQAYFSILTQVAEETAKEFQDARRLDTRLRLTEALKKVIDVARDVGVRRYDLFNAARHHGLYDATMPEIARMKGLAPGERLMDRAGLTELSMHEFQSNLAREKILNEGVTGEARAIRANLEVAQSVRGIVKMHAGMNPEDLPLEAEPIQQVQKRLENKRRGLKGKQ